MNVVEAWLTDLGRLLGEGPIAVSDVRIGVFYTATGHKPRLWEGIEKCISFLAGAPVTWKLGGPQ